ncbi:MAG: transporter associated domain-containing protein [Chloroflexota bacterium]
MFKQSFSDAEFDLNSIMHAPLYVPETMFALDLLEHLKQKHVHMALVFDEYGGLEGLVTSNDLLEAIVGDIDSPTTPYVTRRQDNSLLVDGMMPIEELLELLDLDDLPRVSEGYYQTVGGFMMSALQEVPSEGQYFDWANLRFEVVDMDGLRVDKILVRLYRRPADPANNDME